MKIFELTIQKLNYKEFLEEITDFLKTSPKKEWWRWRSIFTPNPEICLATLEDKEFLQILNESDYLTSDGIGLYLGYQIAENTSGKIVNGLFFPYYVYNIIFRKTYLYEKFGDRICGSDLTHELLNIAQKNKISITILDMPPWDNWKQKSQEELIPTLKEKFPDVKVHFHIYTEENKQEIFAQIRASDTKILFSTLGMKKQEVSVREALYACPNIMLGLWVGSSFDYFTGYQKRAPRIWRLLGFEWLYRIFTSPNTLQRLGRIYNAVVIFSLKVLFDKKAKKN